MLSGEGPFALGNGLVRYAWLFNPQGFQGVSAVAIIYLTYFRNNRPQPSIG